GVAEDERPPGVDEVDVGVAVDVAHAGAAGFGDVDRVASDAAEGADRRVHTAGDDAGGALGVGGRGGGVERLRLPVSHSASLSYRRPGSYRSGSGDARDTFPVGEGGAGAGRFNGCAPASCRV